MALEPVVTALTLKGQYTAVMLQRVVRADVWLRMVASGAIPIGSADVGTPTFVAGVEREARTVDG